MQAADAVKTQVNRQTLGEHFTQPCYLDDTTEKVEPSTVTFACNTLAPNKDVLLHLNDLRHILW